MMDFATTEVGLNTHVPSRVYHFHERCSVVKHNKQCMYT